MTFDAGSVNRPLLHRAMSRAAENLVPFQVALELTYRCNLRCRHCYVDVQAEDELSFDEWKGVLGELASEGSLYLLLTGGEPLVRNDFLRIARYAKERGFVITLLTNGTLITRSVAREIAKLRPMIVGLSLYGATDLVHDGVTGRAGSYEATLRGIALLREFGVPVALQATLMDCNVHEAKAMTALAETLGSPLRLGYEVAPTKSCALSPQCHEASITDLQRYLDAGQVRSTLTRTDEVGVCKAGRGICSVSPSGNVFPCIMMPLEMGNVRSRKFGDIWRDGGNRRLASLRAISRYDLHECDECELSVFCNRCIGRNLSETGHLTRPAPGTCRNAVARARLLQSS